jgi:hypothetical protein
MSNPDEETAIDQFGDGDKYFGVLVLMCTLPGLPMFAHGQIEGYTEKYGMEYQRAYYNEEPKQWLVDRHSREIFPILRKRSVFSEVKNYWLYDFIDNNGQLNENVFVYTNESRGEKSLVLFNNKYESTSGKFLNSRQKLNGNSSGNNYLHNISIGDNLHIKNSDFHFYIMRDITTGLEYFYNGTEIYHNGIFVNLGGYEYRVFLFFEEVFDSSGDSYKFYKENYGRGIYSIKDELKKIKLSAIHNSFEKMFDEDIITQYCDLLLLKKKSLKEKQKFEQKLVKNISIFSDEISNQFNVVSNKEKFNQELSSSIIENINYFNQMIKVLKNSKIKVDSEILKFFKDYTEEKWFLQFLIIIVTRLKNLFLVDDRIYNEYMSELMLNEPIVKVFIKNISEKEKINSQILLINLILQFEEKFEKIEEIPDEFLSLRSGKQLYEYFFIHEIKYLTDLVKSELGKSYLEVNKYKDKTYFSKERFEDLIDAVTLYVIKKYSQSDASLVEISANKKKLEIRITKKMYVLNQYLRIQANNSEYIYDDLLENLGL